MILGKTLVSKECAIRMVKKIDAELEKLNDHKKLLEKAEESSQNVEFFTPNQSQKITNGEEETERYFSATEEFEDIEEDPLQEIG